MANIKEAFEYASKNPDSDFAKNLAQLASSGALNTEAKANGIDLTPFQPKTEEIIPEKQGETGLKGIATGVGKGVLSTIKGMGQLGEKIGGAILPESVTPESVYSEEALQKSADKGGAGKLLTEENLEAKTTAEKIGKGGEQIAEFAVPSSIVSKATKGASLVGKILPRAITSGSVASIQSGDIGKETAIAAGIETALPVVGAILKPATKIISGLFKNTGSALSGVPSETLIKISNNPEVAKDTIKIIKEAGQEKVLMDNIKTYMNGVSKIKKEASQAFGSGIEALQKTDIDDKVFRQGTQKILDKYGSFVKNGKRELSNIEFSDPKNISKANDLISKLQKANLDGKSLRKLADDIENSAYKIATTDERLSFNSFVKDLSSTLKNTISQSTSKLDDINKAYSKDISLVNGIQKILGKVKFKNDSEMIDVSKKLDTLFNQKGLSQQYVDDFLTRIGVTPEDFKTSEAVRQISNIEAGVNTMGTNRMELIRSATASIVTPKLVRDIAVLTGKAENVIKPLLESLNPTMRASLIELLLPENK